SAAIRACPDPLPQAGGRGKCRVCSFLSVSGSGSAIAAAPGAAMVRTVAIALMVLLAGQSVASANDGPLDISFGFLGQVELAPAGMAADSVGTLRMRVDGQHRIVGCVRTVTPSNATVPWLFRLSVNGGNDTSFAGTGSKF